MISPVSGSYKAIKYAYDAKLTNFDPDNNILSTQTFNEVCSISFNEDYIIECYTICKYVNWIGMHGEIGDKNKYRKHIYIFE